MAPNEPTARVRITYREALRMALRDALQRDERVFLMGEDVARYGGSYAVSKGLFEEFGEERIRDTPLSESVFVGAGIGAAMNGMRPIVEIMTVNFSLLALDQIVNNAATLRHMSGGQISVPLVIRMATGGGRQLAAQHSHSLEGWYAHIPGLRILAPATLEDARGMLWTALEDPDPVIIFEHALLYNLEGELPADAGAVDIDTAAVRRTGNDVTLIAYGGTLGKTMQAAEQLAQTGIGAEVIDLRTLRPLDTDTILTSVRKTHRAVVVDEGWKSVGLSAEISARIMEGALYELDAPVARVCSRGSPDPLRQAYGGGGSAANSRHRCRGTRGLCTVHEFRMPVLGADMEAGELVEWLIKPGQQVKRGDVVAIVETEKGAVDVEIWEDGIVDALIVEPGTTVPAGTVLAILQGEASALAAPPPDSGAVAPAPVAPSAEAAKPAPVAVPAERYKVSPAARRKAQELRVDLAKLVPSGPEGVISLADVERAARAGPPPVADRTEAMRRAIAAAMTKSKREIPHYYLANSIDVTPAVGWLARENASTQRAGPHPVRCGPPACGGPGAQGSAGVERCLARRPPADVARGPSGCRHRLARRRSGCARDPQRPRQDDRGNDELRCPTWCGARARAACAAPSWAKQPSR